MRRRGPAFLAVLAVAALAVGCTSTKSGSDQSTGDGKVKIGLVTKTDSNPYFVALRDAAKAQAEKNGAELVALAGKFDGDNDGQVAAIENLVQQGAKTILVTRATRPASSAPSRRPVTAASWSSRSTPRPTRRTRSTRPSRPTTPRPAACRAST